MGEIKSALELALERTRDIAGDPEALHRNEAQKDGKRLYARLRSGESVDIAKELASLPGERRAWVREGLFEVILSNLTLPQYESDLENLDTTEKALSELGGDRGTLRSIMRQTREFFSQYLADRQQMIESLRQQFGPRLRQKEQQLEQQYGRPVRIDPSTDPEFSAVLQDNLGRLDGQYRGALSQIFDHLKSMFDI